MATENSAHTLFRDPPPQHHTKVKVYVQPQDKESVLFYFLPCTHPNENDDTTLSVLVGSETL